MPQESLDEWLNTVRANHSTQQSVELDDWLDGVRQQANTANNEGAFKDWYSGHASRLGLDPNPDDPRHFYDYRAAFKAGARPDESGHWPSEFKRDGHPRMVVDGVNTKTGEPQPTSNLDFLPEVQASKTPFDPWAQLARDREANRTPFEAAIDKLPPERREIVRAAQERTANRSWGEWADDKVMAAAEGLGSVVGAPISTAGLGLKLYDQIMQAVLPQTMANIHDYVVGGLADKVIGAGEALGTRETLGIAQNPYMQDTLAHGLAKGAGQAVGFLSGGVAANAAKLPLKAATGLLGAGVGAAQMYADAKANGASDRKALLSALAGAGLGSTEILGLGPVFNNLFSPKMRGVTMAVLEAVKSTGAEAGQETLQTIGENLVAKGLYDPERDAMQGVGQAATIGGVLGAVLGGLSQIGKVKRKPKGTSRAAFQDAGLSDMKLTKPEREAYMEGFNDQPPNLAPDFDKPAATFGQGTLVEPESPPASAATPPTEQSGPPQPWQMSREDFEGKIQSHPDYPDLSPPTPEPPSAQEAPAPEQPYVALNLRETAFIRDSLGLDKLPPAKRAPWEQVVNEVITSKGYENALDTANSVLEGKFEVPIEKQTAQHVSNIIAVSKRMTARKAAQEKSFELLESGDANGSMVATEQANRLLQEIDKITDADRRMGTIASQALAIRNLKLDPDAYSIVNVRQRARLAKVRPDSQGVPTLNEAESTKLDELTNRIEELEKTIQRQAETDAVRLEEIARLKAEKEIERETRKRSSRKAKIEKIQADRSDAINRLKSLGMRMNDISGLGPEALWQLSRVAVSYIHEGVVRLPDLVAKIRAISPDITDQDVYEALNARNPANTRKARTEVQKEISRLKREGKMHAELADLENQMTTGEFKPRKKLEKRQVTPEMEKLEIELKHAKRAVDQAINRMTPKTRRQKAGAVITEVSAAARSLKASLDLSSTLRQGLFLTLSHPILASKAFAQAMRATFSENAAQRLDNELRNAPHHYMRLAAGMDFSDLDGPVNAREEFLASRFVEHFPILGRFVRGSSRHMVTFLNLLRASVFDSFLEANPTASRKDLKGIANMINVTTGRGASMGSGLAASAANLIFFAPRFAISRVQSLLLPFMPSTWELGSAARNEVLRTWVTTVGAVGGLIGLIALAYEDDKRVDVGTNPRKSDWGKITIKGVQYDPWGGLIQPARLLARAGISSYEAFKGMPASKRINIGDEVERFMKYKWAPISTIPYELTTRRKVTGEKTTPKQTALDAITPISIGDIIQAYQDGGISRAARVGVPSMLGVGAGTPHK